MRGKQETKATDANLQGGLFPKPSPSWPRLLSHQRVLRCSSGRSHSTPPLPVDDGRSRLDGKTPGRSAAAHRLVLACLHSRLPAEATPSSPLPHAPVAPSRGAQANPSILAILLCNPAQAAYRLGIAGSHNSQNKHAFSGEWCSQFRHGNFLQILKVWKAKKFYARKMITLCMLPAVSLVSSINIKRLQLAKCMPNVSLKYFKCSVLDVLHIT